MSTKNDLENALKDALRSGDESRKRTLRMALASIRQAEIDRNIQADDNTVIAILQKEIKSRHESILDAQRAVRPELIALAEAEIAILETFLPKAISAQELETLARQSIAEANATSMKDMGKVMKILLPLLQGRATGDQASQAVRKLLG